MKIKHAMSGWCYSNVHQNLANVENKIWSYKCMNLIGKNEAFELMFFQKMWIITIKMFYRYMYAATFNGLAL